jgi:DNA invertase Pin-like site-specific DNA recombinase
METGLIDTLVVWRLDRLGRTAKGLIGLFDDLVCWKVNLISLKDGLDLTTASGRLMANILAGLAAYETEVRAERIRAGQEVARAAGIRAPVTSHPGTTHLVRQMRSQGNR